MVYEKLNLSNGDKFNAEHVAHIENGIEAAVAQANENASNVNRLSDEMAELPEHVKQDVIESMTKFDVEGDFVQFTPKEGSEIKAVTSFSGHNPYWGYLYLHHVTSKNLQDFANRFGGVGTVIEKDGLTATINEDATVTITGTNTSSGWVNILQVSNDKPYCDYIYPAGTYTIPVGLVVQTIDPSGVNNFGNKTKTFTIDVPFRIFGAYIAYASGKTVNETIPLCMVRGTVMPQDNYKYSGIVHQVWFTKKYTEGTYDWSTGNLYDMEGNLLETTAIVGISAIAGENSMWVGNGTVRATGETAGMYIGGGGSSVEAFDPEVWGLPILRLNGETQAMNKDNAVELSFVFGTHKCESTTKWQGSSSLSFPEKNYSIKCSVAFEAKEGWGEQTKYVAKADWVDASHLLNILGAIIWGQIVKRSGANYPAASKALPNGGAIDGFPVLLVINDKLQGLYTFTIPKNDWMAGMTGIEGEFILNADGNNAACAFKAIPADDDSDFEAEYSASDGTLVAGRAMLKTCVTDTINAVDMGENIDKPFDNLNYDSALDYMVFCACLCNPDGITKNYQLFGRPSEKLQFSAYDMDAILGNHYNGQSYFAPDYMTYNGLANTHNIFKLIYTHKKADLKARHKLLRETILNEANILTVATNYAVQIPSTVLAEDRRLWPGKPGTLTNDINRMMNFLRVRLAIVDAEIEAM